MEEIFQESKPNEDKRNKSSIWGHTARSEVQVIVSDRKHVKVSIETVANFTSPMWVLDASHVKLQIYVLSCKYIPFQ